MSFRGLITLSEGNRRCDMGSNPTVTAAMEAPEKSGVFPFPGCGVAPFGAGFEMPDAKSRPQGAVKTSVPCSVR